MAGSLRKRLGTHTAVAECGGVGGRIVLEPQVVGEQCLGLFHAACPAKRLRTRPIGAAEIGVEFRRAQKPGSRLRVASRWQQGLAKEIGGVRIVWIGIGGPPQHRFRRFRLAEIEAAGGR